MPIYITTVRNAAEKLANAKTAALDLTRGIQDALQRASAFKDPNLSEDGIAAKRRELRAEFKQAGEADLTKLKTDVHNARTWLAEYAKENTTLEADAATLIRAEQKWRQVERQLEAGIDLRSVLADADNVTALAVLEYGPSWAKATGYRPPTMQEAIDAALTGAAPKNASLWLQRLAYKRVAETTDDAALAELLHAAAAADGQYAAAKPYIEAADSLITHGSADLLTAGIASQIAEKESAPVAA